MVINTVSQDDHLDDLIEEEEPEDLYDDGFDDEDDFEFQEKILIASPKVSITTEEKIIIPSPKVSITEENDIPIVVNNKTSFEERILAASPEAQVYQELQQCDTCGRKFNPTALERHIKVGLCNYIFLRPLFRVCLFLKWIKDTKTFR